MMDKEPIYKGAMMRGMREWFEDGMKWAREKLEPVHLEEGRYCMLYELAGMLDVDKKCRIVIEYDPNHPKIAAYREPLAGEVKQFTDVRGTFWPEDVPESRNVQSGLPMQEITEHPAGEYCVK